MLKYHIIVYGCQMNTSDSERIATLLETKGYKKAVKSTTADLVVITSCSVRQKPIDKIKNQILTLNRQKKKPEIIVTGCVLDADKKIFKKMGAIVKNFKEIENITPTENYVPITRGCDNFCTYCAVPYTRGRIRHRSKTKIITEIKSLIKKGHKEIMLLGQNVNSYPDFVGLLRKVTSLSGNFKIKFITNHPKDFSDELIQEMANNPKIVKYIHLPYQAGDNTILKRMNRQYTRSYYLKLVSKIKKAMPNVDITTDVIVGFPGETKKQFQHTVDVAKTVGFKQIYIGKFSPRSGTPAALLRDNVPLEEKKRRERVLREAIVSKS